MADRERSVLDQYAPPEPPRRVHNTLTGDPVRTERPHIAPLEEPSSPSHRHFTEWLRQHGIDPLQARTLGSYAPFTPMGGAYDIGYNMLGPAIEERDPIRGAIGLGLLGWGAGIPGPSRFVARPPAGAVAERLAERGRQYQNRLAEIVESVYDTTGSTAAARRPSGAGTEARGVPDRGGMEGGGRGVPSSGRALDPYAPIPGQPRIVRIPGHGEVEARPIPQIEEAARTHARRMGRDYYPPASMPPFDEDRARRIAAAFREMQHNPGDPRVQRAYDAMIEETLQQYRALVDAGFEFHFNPPGQDPYRASPALGYLDMRDRGRLFAFPTLEGFGSGAGLTREQIADNPLLRDTGIVISGQPATANDLFRIVHDAFGHNGPGNPFFRHQGEERAFRHHAPLYTDEALPAITPELRGQNNELNFGTHGDFNRGASAADTIYADQKVGRMPDWTWEDVYPLGVRPPEGRARGGRAPRRNNILARYSRGR